MEQKDKEAKNLAAKVQEEKIREEKEKQKLRLVSEGKKLAVRFDTRQRYRCKILKYICYLTGKRKLPKQNKEENKRRRIVFNG